MYWQPMIANKWLLVPGVALAEHVTLPDPGPCHMPGMFVLADPDRVRGRPCRRGMERRRPYVG